MIHHEFISPLLSQLFLFSQNTVPGLFDPAGISKSRSEEAKAKGRDSEIKNGRLAMIAIGGMVTGAAITGNGFPYLP